MALSIAVQVHLHYLFAEWYSTYSRCLTIRAVKVSFSSFVSYSSSLLPVCKSFSPAPPLKTRFRDLWRRVWWVSNKLKSSMRGGRDKSFVTGLPLFFGS